MKAVLFGAGGVGRGFLAHLLHESQWQITFVDVASNLVRGLNLAGAYRIRLAKDGYPSVQIRGIRAIEASQEDAVSEAISEAEVAFTAVGGNVLPLVAPSLAQGMKKKAGLPGNHPLNVFVCENLPHAATVLKDSVFSQLSGSMRLWSEENVGFAGVVVGRMIPVLPEAWRQEDPLQVIAEDYWILPVDARGVVQPLPSFKGLQVCQSFQAEEARKLYTHNMAHAVFAYHGYLKGHRFIWEAAADPQIRDWAEQSLREASAGLCRRYHLDEAGQREYAVSLIPRLENRFLMDTVLRVGRDPLRKLGAEDRLIGAARLALDAGVAPQALVGAIVACLRFNPPEDPSAVELQRRLERNGVRGVLRDVAQLREDEPLFISVLHAWEGTL